MDAFSTIDMMRFMGRAVRAAQKNCTTGDGGPFGACIVKDGRIVSVGRNTVLKENDPTCHAEINAIRRAAKKLRSYDLSGCVCYTTTEPCPMCFAALHWARVDGIVYGTTIRDVSALGFHELLVPVRTLQKIGKSTIQIVHNDPKGICKGLLDHWKRYSARRTY